MFHGNISNKQAPIICFDADILFADEPADPSFIEKLVRKIIGKDNVVDLDVVNTINNIWYSHDLSIYIAVSEKHEDLTELLHDHDVCYTRLTKYSSIELLRQRCQYEYFFYVSNNLEHLSVISMKNAITLEELGRQINTTRR